MKKGVPRRFSRFCRIALAALEFISSAVSTITTRQPASAAIAEEWDHRRQPPHAASVGVAV